MLPNCPQAESKLEASKLGDYQGLLLKDKSTNSNQSQECSLNNSKHSALGSSPYGTGQMQTLEAYQELKLYCKRCTKSR